MEKRSARKACGKEIVGTCRDSKENGGYGHRPARTAGRQVNIGGTCDDNVSKRILRNAIGFLFGHHGHVGSVEGKYCRDLPRLMSMSKENAEKRQQERPWRRSVV